jgi:hypothetical protein
MLRPLTLLAMTAALSCLVPAADAGTVVEVTVHGTVEFNLLNTGALAAVDDGEHGTLRFRVDSDTFVNSGMFPTRGYAIDTASFSFAFDSATVALKSPFPAGTTPYFVLRNNDPAVDGFFLSTNVNDPAGLALNQNGGLGALAASFSVTYGGAELPSLDILAALGSYDFTGLSVFHFSIDDGPFEPFGLVFESMTIAVVDPTWTDAGHALAGVAGTPKLAGTGTLAAGSGNTVTLARAKASAAAGLFVGLAAGAIPFKGGTLVPFPFLTPIVLATSASGTIAIPFTMPAGVPPATGLWLQCAIQDPAAVEGVALSNALAGVTP